MGGGRRGKLSHVDGFATTRAASPDKINRGPETVVHRKREVGHPTSSRGCQQVIIICMWTVCPASSFCPSRHRRAQTESHHMCCQRLCVLAAAPADQIEPWLLLLAHQPGKPPSPLLDRTTPLAHTASHADRSQPAQVRAQALQPAAGARLECVGWDRLGLVLLVVGHGA
jgi:hypothetical protein